MSGQLVGLLGQPVGPLLTIMGTSLNGTRRTPVCVLPCFEHLCRLPSVGQTQGHSPRRRSSGMLDNASPRGLKVRACDRRAPTSASLRLAIGDSPISRMKVRTPGSLTDPATGLH